MPDDGVRGSVGEFRRALQAIPAEDIAEAIPWTADGARPRRRRAQGRPLPTGTRHAAGTLMGR